MSASAMGRTAESRWRGKVNRFVAGLARARLPPGVQEVCRGVVGSGIGLADSSLVVMSGGADRVPRHGTPATVLGHRCQSLDSLVVLASPRDNGG